MPKKSIRIFSFSFISLFISILLLSGIAVAQNSPPIAEAGPQQTIILGDSITLHGTATDPDGHTIVGWQWDVISAPAGSTYDLADANTPDAIFTANMLGDYIITLIVSDGLAWSDPDGTLVTVVANQPPVAVISADPTSGAAPLTVNFDGTGSYDPEGRPLSYDWDFSGDHRTGATTTYTFQDAETYFVFLAVTDDRGGDDFDTVEIRVGCLDVSPKVQDFGDVEVNASSSIIFTVTKVCNRPTGTTTVSSIGLGAGSNSSYAITQTPQLPASLLIGDTVDVEVTFSPTATGYQEASLEVQSDDLNSTITVPLSGVGVEVEPPPTIVEDILNEFDTSVGDGTLVGDGNGNSANGRKKALRNRIEAIDDLIADGDIEGACRQLTDAYKKCDSQPKPPDFVAGSSAPDLALDILELMGTLGCE